MVTIGVLGIVAPGFSALIDESFQFVTFPWKMLLSTEPLRTRLLAPLASLSPGTL